MDETPKYGSLLCTNGECMNIWMDRANSRYDGKKDRNLIVLGVETSYAFLKSISKRE